MKACKVQLNLCLEGSLFISLNGCSRKKERFTNQSFKSPKSHDIPREGSVHWDLQKLKEEKNKGKSRN